jgi:hypothetical protein
MNFQSTSAELPVRYNPTQSAALPGPSAIVAVTVVPGAAVVVLTLTLVFPMTWMDTLRVETM